MVARRDSDLLAEIERDVLDESKSVAAALRKCLALGGQAKSAELRDWASRELHGYPDEAAAPGLPEDPDAAAHGRVHRRRDLPRQASQRHRPSSRKPAMSWGMSCP